MCGENNKYIVFLYDDNGDIGSLIGFASALPQYPELNVTSEVVKLPAAFMLGKTYQATIIKNLIDQPRVAYIPLDARPLAL